MKINQIDFNFLIFFMENNKNIAIIIENKLCPAHQLNFINVAFVRQPLLYPL